ncbi:hypothetical protein F66182_14387, partial [Fusarium sp. NRRL 66182]
AAANAAKSVQEEVSNSIPPSNGIEGTTYGDAHVNGHGHTLAPAGRPGLTEQQQPLGYPMSSVHGLNNGHVGDSFNHAQADHRASWMAAQKQSPYLVHSSGSAEGPGGHPNNIDRHSFEQAKPPMVDPKRPMMPGQPQQPQQQHPGELDWTTMFQPGAPEGYMHSVFPQSMAPQHEPIHSHVDPDRKYYPTTTGPHQDGGLNGLYLASTSLSGDGMRNPSGVPNNEKTNPQEPIAT